MAAKVGAPQEAEVGRFTALRHELRGNKQRLRKRPRVFDPSQETHAKPRPDAGAP